MGVIGYILAVTATGALIAWIVGICLAAIHNVRDRGEQGEG